MTSHNQHQWLKKDIFLKLKKNMLRSLLYLQGTNALQMLAKKDCS
jgi:hypothetical protein